MWANSYLLMSMTATLTVLLLQPHLHGVGTACIKVKTSAYSSGGNHVLCMALLRQQKHLFLCSPQLPLQALFFLCFLPWCLLSLCPFVAGFFLCFSPHKGGVTRGCSQISFLFVLACCFSFINLSISLWPNMHTKWKTHRHIQHRGKTTESTAK